MPRRNKIEEIVEEAEVVDNYHVPPPLRQRRPKDIRIKDMIFVFWLILTLAMCLVTASFHSFYAPIVYGVIAGLWAYLWSKTHPEPDLEYRQQRAKKNAFGCWSCVLFVIEAFVIFYGMWKLAMTSDPNRPISPCGKSSCCPYVNDQTCGPYNAAGWRVRTPPFMFCPHAECTWGSVNNEPIIGYYAKVNDSLSPDLTRPCTPQDEDCDHLASSIPKDYPDPGYGLTDGYYEGVTTTNKEMCPFVDQVANNGITNGKGLGMCTTCSKYMYEFYGYGDSSAMNCPSGSGNLFCFICSDVSYQHLWQRYAVNTTLMIHIMATLGLMIIRMTCLH
jgi:hypothetical protein